MTCNGHFHPDAYLSVYSCIQKFGCMYAHMHVCTRIDGTRSILAHAASLTCISAWTCLHGFIRPLHAIYACTHTHSHARTHLCKHARKHACIARPCSRRELSHVYACTCRACAHACAWCMWGGVFVAVCVCVDWLGESATSCRAAVDPSGWRHGHRHDDQATFRF